MMHADLLNRRSLGSLNSLQEDSLSTFNDAFTIYGHPKVKDLLKAFEQLQVVQLPDYRTALKLRCIQRRMELHRVDVRDIATVFSECGLPPGPEELGESDMEPVISDVCLMAERSAETTAVSCSDLILTWILQLFDNNYAGVVTVRQFTTSLVIIGNGRLLDKLKYIYDAFKGPDGLLSQQGFSDLLTDLLLIPCSVFEEEIYGNTNLVLGALYDCFNQLGHEREKISIDEFLQWSIQRPFTLSWLFTFHRIMCSEYSVNLNTCSSCGIAPFLGFRYSALLHYSYTICQDCAWTGNCDGESEFREFGALGQCVNITTNPKSFNTSSASLLGSLTHVQKHLDPRYEKLLSYCKRLDPASPSHFLKLHDLVDQVGDSTDALIGECEDRATKLQKDFALLSTEHSHILKLERRDSLSSLESLQVWKKRDDLSSRLAIWMSRRNDLYEKHEDILSENKVEPPTLKYRKCSALGSSRSISSTSSSTSLRVSDGVSKTKVSVEESVLVLGKLSLIINNALLQKSLGSPQVRTPTVVTSSPQLTRVQRVSRESPPPSPLAFENKIHSKVNGNHFSSSKENVTCNVPLTSEDDVLDAFERSMTDIMIQVPVKEETEDPPPPPQEEEEKKKEEEDDDEETEEVTGEWESEGDWETEDDSTEMSGPPDSLNIGGVSEPECDPPEAPKRSGDSAPVPPPRNLLSPIGASRRATSLKTKESDPKMEELRKVTRAASSVNSKSKSLGPQGSQTPPFATRIPTPKAYNTDSPEQSSKPKPSGIRKPSKPIRGPIVYEGDTDSETDSSSTSSSSPDRKKKSKFSRARSARFVRNKTSAPNRNAASFKAKRNTKPPAELGFFNNFAE